MCATTFTGKQVGCSPQQSLTLETATVRRWLLDIDTTIRWTADENVVINGVTTARQLSRANLL